MNAPGLTTLCRRLPPISAGLVSFLAMAGCGSDVNTFTAPGALPKCALEIGSVTSTIPATGATGTIAVTAARECQWTAAPEVEWLTLTSGGSGQGDGAVQFSASPNADPIVRTGGILLNDQRAAITQAAGECRIELASNSAQFPGAGGTGTVQVRASSQQCTWTATTDAFWIVIRSGSSGTGDGTVTFDVPPVEGPPRMATLTIGGQPFSVTQSEGCSYAIAPASHSAGGAGEVGQFAITTADGCPWTASSSADWIAVTEGAAGEGSGTVVFSVAPTTGPARSGAIVAAGRVFDVRQSQGCSYDVAPATFSFDAGGGSGAVSVATAPGCAWSASSGASWIALDSAGGTGPGSVGFSVAPAAGEARSGTLTVAGRTVSVTQAQACSYSISPGSQSIPQGGGSGTVTVTAPAECAWTAVSGAEWITVTSGAEGTGAGSVAFSVAPNSGSARTGSIAIAGRTFTVNQQESCSASISPTETTVDAAGGTLSVAVAAGSTCAWTASSNVPWVTVSSGASGTGLGAVQLAVAANEQNVRTGTVTIAGLTFTVRQTAACSYTLSVETVAVAAAGGTSSVTVTAPASCAWTAESGASWIAIVSGESGTGEGSIQLDVQPNAGGARDGAVTIAGRVVTVTQAAAPCAYSVAPTSVAMERTGGRESIAVVTQAHCTWTAVSHAEWITLTSGTSGSGDGAVEFRAPPTQEDRQGTITIAGETVTVTQSGRD